MSDWLMRAFFIIALICTHPYICFSQVDSSFIGSFDKKMAFKASFSKNFISLKQEQLNKAKEYLPNNPMSLGLGISIYNTILSGSFGYPFDFTIDNDLGKTKVFDFQIHNYSRKFVVDVFLQNYKGFYMNEDEKSEYKLSPDLRIEQYGAFGQYVLNHNKFSYKAAFGQNEKQLKSAGSFLLGVGVFYSRIDSDSSFVYENKNTLRNFQLGLSGGYAYTWIHKKKYYLSGSLTTGIAFGYEKAEDFGKKKLEIYPTIFPRISGGYNTDDWSLGFSYISNMIFPVFLQDHSLILSAGTFQLTYIKRIHTLPFLSNIIKKYYK